MKKVLVLLASLLLVAGMIVMGIGCAATTSSTGNATNVNPSFLHYGTLQGKIMNAITGEALGGDDLKVYLILGTDKREPDKLVKDTTDTFVGEYAFDNVPVGLAAAGNNELNFKIVVTKDNYQKFETIAAFNAVLVAGQSGGNWQVDNTFNNETFNMIGDIYLYPLGSSPGDLTVYVYGPQGRPIENASVLLQQNVNNNGIVANTGFRLAATAGMHPSLTATSDSSGKATFASTDLVLGGNYNVTVKPMTFEGQELRTTAGNAFTVGTNTMTQTVNMVVATGTQALVATSASNQLPGTVTANGILTVTFNQPILLSTTNFTVTMTDPNAVGVVTSPVTGVLSTDGLTLTLTPVITTAPTGAGSYLTYSYGGAIYLKNSQTTVASAYTLFTGGANDVVNSVTGNAVSGRVLLLSH